MQLLLLRSRVAIRGFPSTAACLATASGAAVMWRSGTATLAPSSRAPPLRTACTTAGRRPRPNASPNRRQPASLQVEAPAGSRLERPSPACNRQARSSSSTSSQTVRKAPRVAPFCPKNESFYRDRLGTNIGKTQKQRRLSQATSACTRAATRATTEARCGARVATREARPRRTRLCCRRTEISARTHPLLLLLLLQRLCGARTHQYARKRRATFGLGWATTVGSACTAARRVARMVWSTCGVRQNRAPACAQPPAPAERGPPHARFPPAAPWGAACGAPPRRFLQSAPGLRFLQRFS
jgi:hypothetical protein